MIMLTAAEILQASNGKTLNDWRPECEKVKKTASVKSLKLEGELNDMLEALGNDQLSANQWAERAGYKPELIRHRANILIKRKLIKRTTGVMPFLFFKA